MIKTLHFDFGEIRVFKNFVVVIMKEGITVKPEDNQHLVNISKEYFSERCFGYITYRINSYAVNPMVYIETSKIENLVAFAVVSAEGLKVSNLQLEKRFITIPFEHFSDLDNAKNWVNGLVSKRDS
ncbi:hypothetical protein [Aequorivita lipolytica]|uniref:STAS/SEC14 domain-containing protein n=1 Tax=Aequorivita lipolytica TaxID=153267 RepID=A0A5C6YP00_9FLAO|nr:hypothetical protein [Aequorivita lipolytica]TXD69083.1 hypothetical protein ESV24_08530 [Aequorivita lipolytica]SRX51348.1 hypothetical protein AEQU2_01828 [Aequorivita lipolytica]